MAFAFNADFVIVSGGVRGKLWIQGVEMQPRRHITPVNAVSDEITKGIRSHAQQQGRCPLPSSGLQAAEACRGYATGRSND